MGREVASEAFEGESIPSPSPGFSMLPTVLVTPWLLCHPNSDSIFTQASPLYLLCLLVCLLRGHEIQGPPYIQDDLQILH